MANVNSQEELVDAQNTPGSAQERTNIELETLDQALGTVTRSDSNSSHDAQAVLDRLQFLEIQHRELKLLVHYYHDDPSDYPHTEPPPKVEKNPSGPECEIARISIAEWRARQDKAYTEIRYSLLTVAPKERGDSGSRGQAIEVQPGPLRGSGEPPIEASALHAPGSKNTSGKPYRAILNGRAGLMEVLGEIFDMQAGPGFYLWFWPFKHLIAQGHKIRARLSEEESKIEDAVSKVKSEASPPVAGEAEDVTVPQEHDSRSKANQASSVSQAPIDSVEDLKLKSKDQEQMASHEVVQAGQDAAESVHHTVHKKTKADHSPADMKTERIKAEDSLQDVKPDTQTVHDTRLRDELRCLVTFMDIDLKDLFSVQKDIDNGTRKLIAFDHLWQLYKPGEVVISGKGQKRAYVVLHVTGGRRLQRTSQTGIAKNDVIKNNTFYEREEREAYFAKYPKTTPFVIDCFYLDFDGTKFGPMPQKFMLQDYEGEIPITSLEVFPLRLDDHPKVTEKSLERRGRKFVKLANVEHRYYSGRTLREDTVLEVPGEVHGEIIVDFALAIKALRGRDIRVPSFDREFRFGTDWEFKFGTGVIANPTPPDERELQGYFGIANTRTMFMEDDGYDNDRRADFLENTPLLTERSHHEKLPKQALVLLPPRVYGFSLLDRKWFAFDISLVEDIKRTNKGFDNLVIPEQHKKIVQALVRHHTKGPRTIPAEMKETDHDFSMDIVRGKGKGLIILLHGVPGVGKTSTAECVAAQTGRPLFPITCGDIGSTAEVVENRLNNYFDMAHKWGCVLLLDEADVFLAKREKGGDLQRNGIVSVFLRVLEYYSGILILTTNRIGEFDEAFSSRVHIKLYYPKLDRKSTFEIWKMNIRRVVESEEVGVDVDEDEVKKFARRQWADSAENPTQRWNGRQIRNAFQSAIALAKWDHQESGEDAQTKPCLSVKQFEIVAKTSAHFDAYITKMHGIDEGDTWETIAARELLRKNETPRRPASRLVPASTPTRAARRSGAKAERFEDDEEGDETDTDENEEQMRKLEGKLKRMKQKKQGSPENLLKDSRTEPSKKTVTPEVEAGDSTGSSDEDQD